MKRIVIVLFCFLGLSDFVFSAPVPAPAMALVPCGISIRYFYNDRETIDYEILIPQTASPVIDRDTALNIFDHYSNLKDGIVQQLYYVSHGPVRYISHEMTRGQFIDFINDLVNNSRSDARLCISVFCTSAAAALENLLFDGFINQSSAKDLCDRISLGLCGSEIKALRYFFGCPRRNHYLGNQRED
jgi:hypothetical protein